MKTTLNWTRIDNDTNGNPRYVVHFLSLVTKRENDTLTLDQLYKAALQRAKKVDSCRKYHNKKYGGGIVFQSYNIYDTEKRLLKKLKEDSKN